MSQLDLKIDSVFGGQAPAQYFGQEGSYLSSIAIDPDYPISSSDIKTSGFAVPIGYADFSSTELTSAPLAIINNPKNTLTYVVATNGRIISYDSSLGSETLIASTFTVTIASPAIFSLTAHGLKLDDIVYFSTSGALPTGLTAGTAYYVISAGLTADAFEVSTSAGGAAVNTSGTQSGTHKVTMECHGADYYNNYLYLRTGTNVSRYGPLNNSPALTHGFWVTTCAETALTNTAYPSLRSVTLPNHWGHVHGDNCLYFCDFINGQGMIHKISTKKVTNEGDTDGTVVPSAYNVLDLPFGFYPTDITSASTNLLITGIYTIDTTVDQGKSAFVVWDPTDTTSFFLGPVPLEDSLATAAFNKNGRVFIFTGNAQNGVRVSQYGGGEDVTDVVFQEEGLPPFPGAVDAMGDRITWGGFTTNPSAGAVAYAWGSKDSRLPKGLHNVAKTSSAGATPIITCLKYVLQSSYKQPQLVIGWNDASNYGVDKYSASATLASNLRFMFNLGQKFQIQKIRIPLAGAVDANTTITPKVYLDDLSSNKTLAVINNTNYPSKRKVIYHAPELKDYVGENNFVLELAWTGTTPLPVALPIKITLDVKEDEKN